MLLFFPHYSSLGGRLRKPQTIVFQCNCSGGREVNDASDYKEVKEQLSCLGIES